MSSSQRLFSPSLPIASGAERGEVQLHGKWLRIIQGLWLLLVLINLATLVVSVPGYYHALFTLCPQAVSDCAITDQLNAQTLPVLQQAGFSLNTYALYVIFLDALVSLSFLLISALIIWHRANTWMGLFVSFLLIEFGSLGLSFSHTMGLPANPSGWLALLNVGGTIATMLYYPCLSFFFSTFPDGRFAPRWSWALIGLWIINVFFWIAPIDTPFNLINWPPLLEAGWLSIVFGGSASVQLLRFLHSASPVQRQQIKWLLYGFLPVIILPLCFTLVQTFIPSLNKPGAFLLNTPHSFVLIVLLPLYRFWYLPVPFCVGIALLRYRLWDIDALINRTLVYSVLTATLLGIYLLLVFGGQYLLSHLFPSGDTIALVISTLVVAALFQPLRRRVQQLIDRRFYRSAYNSAQVVARFGETLYQEVNLEQLREQLLSVVQQTMQPASLSLWISPVKVPGEEASSHVFLSQEPGKDSAER